MDGRRQSCSHPNVDTDLDKKIPPKNKVEKPTISSCSQNVLTQRNVENPNPEKGLTQTKNTTNNRAQVASSH